MTFKRVLAIGFVIASACFARTTTNAQESWPSRPVTMVVPFAAGGVSDITTRMIAAKLREHFGQPFIVENRAGAGGNIGAEYVMKAAPDGYTLLQGTSAHATNVSLYQKLHYDFVKDFEPISQISSVPSVLVVPPSMPVNNLAEFITYAKEAKPPLNYGTGGSGSVLHIAAAVFDKRVGSNMVPVPYKGNAPALADLLGGHIQLVFSPVIDALAFVNSGKLKALGVTTKTRSALLPALPAIGELLPGYEVVLWNGIFAPAGTPPGIVNKLSTAIQKIVQDPETKNALAKLGSEPASNSPQVFKSFVAEEVIKWRGLVEMAAAKVE